VGSADEPIGRADGGRARRIVEQRAEGRAILAELAGTFALAAVDAGGFARSSGAGTALAA
jgi:hypothetical protein